MLALLGLLTAAGVLLSFTNFPRSAWLGTLALLAIVTATDAWRLWRAPSPTVTRRVSQSLALDVPVEVRLRIANTADNGLGLEVYDHHPAAFDCEGLPRRLRLPAGTTATVAYRARPTQRGRHAFPGCQLRIRSPLGLLAQSRLVPVHDDVNVFPNFAAVTKYALLGTDHAFSQSGIRQRRRRGEGLEFQQLREYRQGDSFRQIDWKATARMRKLIAKEYQDERDQNVVFLLDTGRRMLTREERLSHFDHVLNAMLLLSYVALRQGDAVGFMTLDAESRWMAPRKGMSTINLLLQRTFALEPGAHAVDYPAAATRLYVRQKRRALVVLLTNVRDEDSADLEGAIRLLRLRHLVLLASLREAELERRLVAPVHDFPAAVGFAATTHFLAARRRAHERLAGSGALLQDTTCAALPAAITNRYLDIKRAGLL